MTRYRTAVAFVAAIVAGTGLGVANDALAAEPFAGFDKAQAVDDAAPAARVARQDGRHVAATPTEKTPRFNAAAFDVRQEPGSQIVTAPFDRKGH